MIRSLQLQPDLTALLKDSLPDGFNGGIPGSWFPRGKFFVSGVTFWGWADTTRYGDDKT